MLSFRQRISIIPYIGYSVCVVELFESSSMTLLRQDWHERGSIEHKAGLHERGYCVVHISGN